MQEGRDSVTFGVLSSDGDIKVMKNWNPVTVKVTEDISMPYMPNLLTVMVIFQCASKTLSDDEREAWTLLARCMTGVKGERAFVLVSEDNSLVGGCGYAHLNGGVFSLNALCVVLKWRRKGVGKKLFDFAFNHLTLPDTQNVMIVVNETNKDAIAFWERMKGVYRPAKHVPANLAPFLLAMSKVSHEGRIYLANK